ncbi:HYC_CC_PP family protein [Robertkochia flava]|uniref:HYC_CC_PP family protein n=1 Tax=Robertkochia flava TaxID=3447986 RepID=UPI001CCFF017|nr:hypothetical protein [Robertkochia marina]
MKAVIKKISAMLMAFVVMFSTMSFSINKHYCMDHLVDVSLILPAEDCGMDMMMAETTKGEQVDATPCCSEEHILIEGQDEVSPAQDGSSEVPQVVIAAFMYSFSLFFEEETPERPEFKDYSPPLLIKDLPVFYESYLI